MSIMSDCRDFAELSKHITAISVVVFLDDFCTETMDDDGMRNWDECKHDTERVDTFVTEFTRQLSDEFPNAAIAVSQDFVDYAQHGLQVDFSKEPSADDIADVMQAIAEIYEEVLNRI